MTDYTRNRRLPFPSSEREVGNGGLHSELFARAVARDLDTVDASWAAELQRPSAQMTRSADVAGYFNSNQTLSVPYDTLEHASTGLGISTSLGSGSFFALAGRQGWYHFSASLHTVASGAVTANVRHRMSIARYGNKFGSFQLKQARYCETYQPAAGEVYNSVEAVLYVEPGDNIYVDYFHLNASSMTLRASGSRFSATLIWAG